MNLLAPRRVSMDLWKTLIGKQIIVRLRGWLIIRVPVLLVLRLLGSHRVVSSRMN